MPVSGPFSKRCRRAMRMQQGIARRFSTLGCPRQVRFVGGADLAFPPADARTPSGRAGSAGSPGVGIAVVYDLITQRIVERRYARRRLTLPYVPGLLSFREEPILRTAMRRIQTPVDVWLFDGHGRAHPRGAGLATHMGVRCGLVSIGVAKSLLIGEMDLDSGAARRHVLADGRELRGVPVRRGDEIIAEALWPQPEAAPIFVSCGQCITLEQALATVLACLNGHRLPEPTHVADSLSKQVRLLSARAGRIFVERDALPQARPNENAV